MNKKEFDECRRLLASKLKAAGFSPREGSTNSAGWSRGWWADVATWGRGRPPIGLWLDRDQHRNLGLWFGFGGPRRQIQNLIDDLQLNKSKKYLKVTVDTIAGTPALGEIKSIKQRIARERLLVHEVINKETDDYEYLGFYQAAPNNVATFVRGAVEKIGDLRNRADADLERDLKKILGASASERLQEILARVGHGQFGKRVRAKWRRCAVTGCDVHAALRASHIVPWNRCRDGFEKRDPNNGILLIANIDAVFDKGLISFDDNGKVLFKNALSRSDRELLGLTENLAIKKLGDEHKGYLRRHRRMYGFPN